MADGKSRSDGLHILIVDDNFAAAQTTGWVVETSGNTYDLAGRADVAIAAAKLRVPDVVLLDIGLPGLDGFELCTEMKAIPALRGTVFIAHTGYGQQQHRDRALEVGCSYFLLKPFDPAKLEAILADVAQQKRGKDILGDEKRPDLSNNAPGPA